VSVRIEPSDVSRVVARRPYAYVVTATDDARPHLRAVVPTWSASIAAFTVRVGSQTSTNVERTGTVTLMWPPMAIAEQAQEFDDHTVIVDCDAKCSPNGDSFELSATPSRAVWHRPARA
jgi:hypothetical protein